MSNKRYTDEFKIQAVKQVTERGHTISDVAKRLDITYKSLYAWIQKYSQPKKSIKQQEDQSDEIKKLKAELKRVTEERDMLKEAAVYFAGESKKSTRS